MRRKRRRQHRGRLWPRLRALLLALCVLSMIGLLGAVASFGYAYNRFERELPDLDDYEAAQLAQTSVVYDRNGDPVDELYGVQNRYVVGREDISPYLRDAVVAIEDRRFYQHEGLDFEAVGRAMVSNLRTLSIQEGGSTITQQLIKNTYIDQELRAVPSFQRKINEAALAWQYEDEHSKQDILNQYLNTVYFGANAYGAEAAARTYFDKPAAELDLEESAMLAGIINLPGAYDPFAHPQIAQKRRDVVLEQMLQRGDISRAEYDEAVSTELEVDPGQIEETEADDYFLNAVRREIVREYGEETLYEGGLEIYTTLDPELQQQADEAVDQVVDPGNGDPSASLVSIEPSTGAVRAMVGGTDFQEVQFNLATQAQRQPGSTFKTFVLAEAINQGISLDTVYESAFLRIPLPSGEVYEVDNYESIERGEIDLREAITASDNTVFVQLGLDLGMQRVVEMAQAMGVDADLEPYASTAIGGLGEGVAPIEMASAYSTLANEGVHAEPYLVERVSRSEGERDVNVEEHELEEERALSQDEAATVTQALEGIGSAEIGREYAGKTGTTDNFIDAWYTGYIPQLTTSVWVGYPNERRSMVNIQGYEEITGGNLPLQIWSSYMRQAAANYPEQPLPEPGEDFLDGLEEDRIGIPPDEREDAEDEDQNGENQDENEDGENGDSENGEGPDNENPDNENPDNENPDGENSGGNDDSENGNSESNGSEDAGSPPDIQTPGDVDPPDVQGFERQTPASPGAGNSPNGNPQGAAAQ